MIPYSCGYPDGIVGHTCYTRAQTFIVAGSGGAASAGSGWPVTVTSGTNSASRSHEKTHFKRFLNEAQIVIVEIKK